MTELILLIDDYIEDVKNSNSYKNLVKYNNIVNTKYKDMYNELINLKIKFDDVSKYGNHHPDYKEVSIKYRDIRVKYYNNEDVKLLKKYEKEVDLLVNSFLNELTKSISSNIPIINELGLVTNNLGGLNCGSC